METDYEIAHKQIMRLNELLNPRHIKVTPNKIIFEKQDEDCDEMGSS
jgi:hypothetical protein